MSESATHPVPFGDCSIAPARLPTACCQSIRRNGQSFATDVLWVRIARQRMLHFAPSPIRNRVHRTRRLADSVSLVQSFRVSTSRFGIGQLADSNRTPLGLHRVAQKIGGGWPVGTVFKGRRPVGFTWKGLPFAPITTRILWLEGLEPGFNRGGNVDSFQRYIYIHGTGDEPSLGRPASHGCVHLAADDLMPLFDKLPVGTLVWISER